MKPEGCRSIMIGTFDTAPVKVAPPDFLDVDQCCRRSTAAKNDACRLTHNGLSPSKWRGSPLSS